jgi:serine/threonine protein kinase/Tol biopolymer transport system component
MLLVGSTISHFKILDKLGEGGMGIVYKARDQLLDRLVAIKVLPSLAAATEERRQRFVLEAKSASALNHPNIVTIYEIGVAGEITFIAMEYVEGRALHEELRTGRLSVSQTLDYSIQLADALSAAHANGIIHRDIKPANILISEKRSVKVLDFGLAKLTEPSRPQGASGDASAATATMAAPLTQERAIVGTASYMSPEQAEGKRVDARSDVFSFGSVLYEMLTSRRAFSGTTTVSTLAAILTREPPPIGDIRDVPLDLAKIVSRCLRKDPARRFQVMTDVKIALDDLREDFGKGTLLPVPGNVQNARRFRLILGLLATVLIAACAAGIFMWGNRPQTPPGPGRFVRLTSDSGLTTDPAISPDGKLVAYASDRSGRGDMDIWVQQTTGGPPIRLTTNEANERQPAFSPDGSKVVFRSERENGGIYVVPTLGGEPVRLAKGGFNPQFSPDGRRITFWTGAQVMVSTPSKIFVVPATGGAPEEIQTGIPFSRHPVWTPDGTRLLFWGTDGFSKVDWYTVDAVREGARSQPPVSCGWFESVGQLQMFDAYYPWGWIGQRAVFPFASGDAHDLWSIRISPRNWRANGPIERLTAGLDSAEHPGVSLTGRAVWAKVQTEINVWSLPVDANTGRVNGEWRQITIGISPKQRPNLSRNGKRAVFNDGAAIALMELGTGKETIIAASGMHASLTADGSKVAYARVRDREGMDLYVDNLTGDIPEKVCTGCGMPSGGWSTDQQKILFDWEAPQVVSLFDLRTRRKTELLRQKGRAFTQAGFSPDDRWILFLAGAGPGRQQVFVMPYREQSPVPMEDQWIAVTDGLSLDSQPRWSPDGSMIYFVSTRDGFRCVWARRVDPATKRPVGEPFVIGHFHSAIRSISNVPTIGLVGLGVSTDRIVVNLGTSTGNIWMADFDSPGQRDTTSPQSKPRQ